MLSGRGCLFLPAGLGLSTALLATSFAYFVPEGHSHHGEEKSKIATLLSKGGSLPSTFRSSILLL
jgi:hypothetical protein